MDETGSMRGLIVTAFSTALLAVGGLALFFALWMLVPDAGLVIR